MSIYKQSDRNNPNRTLERIQLISMVPLEVENKSFTTFPPSPLEVKHHCFKNTISSYTKNIDCKVNVDGLEKKSPRFLENQNIKEKSYCEHRTTPYKPYFKQKKHSNPGVGAYSPQYESILPRSIQITMKRKTIDSENNHLEKKDNNKKNRNRLKKKVKIKNSKPTSPSDLHKSYHSFENKLDSDYEYEYNYEYEYEYDDEIPSSKTDKQFDAYSTADLISLYQANMRDFDGDSINYPKFESLNNADQPGTMEYKAHKESLKGESICFRHDGYRTIFDNNSPAKHLDPADPIPPPLPPVPILSRQKNRELSILDRLKFYNEATENHNIAGAFADDGTFKHFNMHNPQVADLALSLSRNYPNAANQLDKLKPRTPSLPQIKYQTPRFGSPPKNKRVEFLDRLTKEQSTTIKKLSKSQINQAECNHRISITNQTKSIQHTKATLNQIKQPKSKIRPKSAFDLQSSRPKSVFPGHSESPSESKYPSNTIESYKKTITQTKPIKISEGGVRELMWYPI